MCASPIVVAQQSGHEPSLAYVEHDRQWEGDLCTGMHCGTGSIIQIHAPLLLCHTEKATACSVFALR